MERLLLNEAEVLTLNSRVSSLGVKQVCDKLKICRQTFRRLLHEPFAEFRSYGKRQLMIELLEGDSKPSSLEVDSFGCSKVSSIPREIALIDIINESLNKFDEEKLKKTLKFVMALEEE